MSPAKAAVATAAVEPQCSTTHRFAVSFASDPTRVRHIRRITSAHLRLWKVTGPTADNVVLSVSELVTNAIQHGGHGDIGLRVRYTAGDLRVDVTDGNPASAVLRSAGDDDVSGRGLLLVSRLAKDWGVDDHGRTTWCAFHATGRS